MKITTVRHSLSITEADSPLSIGRADSCNIVCDHPMVSSRHALLSWTGECWVLDDNGSRNGIFVGGRQVDRVRLTSLMTVSLGDDVNGFAVTFDPAVVSAPVPTATATSSRAVPARAPAAQQPARDVVFAVHDLVVETAGVRRLDRVSFQLRRGEMLGVLGGSGAGKSTLLKAITGSDPATSGLVMFQQRDLYRDYEALRTSIGYVPQDDILHASLTVRATLDFGAMLRMPSASTADRTARVAEVLDELGIAHRIDAKVTELSGGQRKRLNVALELLSRPELLILDEPTSGLDPANERALMQLLRQLADSGRTIIVVTHSTESLHLCNRVLFLGRGGLPVYLDTSADMAAHFGQSSLIDAFGFVDNHPDPSHLRNRFDAAHPADARPVPLDPIPPAAPQPLRQRWAKDSERVGHDFWVMVRRSVAILRGDKRNAIFLLAQGPVIALLIMVAFGGRPFVAENPKDSGAAQVLATLVLAVVFVGAAGAVREIVKERSIMLREQAVGVSTTAYLGSKVAVQGTLVIAQAVLITFFALVRQDTPDKSLLALGANAEVALLVILAGLGAMGIGLFISATVNSADKAMTALPILLFTQLLLVGIIVPLNGVALRPLSWLIGAQWSFNGAAAVNNLWEGQRCYMDDASKFCQGMWHHDTTNLLLSLLMLTLLFGAALYFALSRLRKQDPAVVLKEAMANG